jgi:hypothetical protein
MMSYKGRKIKDSFGVDVGGRRHMPDLGFAAESYGKVLARGGECERCDRRSEGEVIDGDATVYIGENGMSILVNGEQKVAAGREADAGDVLAMSKREGVGFVTVNSINIRNPPSKRNYITYSTRLKTVTRLPTGENRWVPSGLKSRLPWQ